MPVQNDKPFVTHITLEVTLRLPNGESFVSSLDLPAEEDALRRSTRTGRLFDEAVRSIDDLLDPLPRVATAAEWAQRTAAGERVRLDPTLQTKSNKDGQHANG